MEPGLLNYRQILHCLSHQGGSKIQSMQKRVSVLRTKNRDKVGTASAAGQPLDRPGRVKGFWELIANFYSLKIKKIPVGRLVLGDWLECYKVSTVVGIFVQLGPGILLVMINRAFGNSYKGTQSALEVSLVLGFPSVTLGQCLKPVVWGARLNNANYLELGHVWQVRSIILPSHQKPGANSRVFRSPTLLINWLPIQGFPVLTNVL